MRQSLSEGKAIVEAVRWMRAIDLRARTSARWDDASEARRGDRGRPCDGATKARE